MNPTFRNVLVTLCGAASVLWAVHDAIAAQPKPGDMFPAFEQFTLEGKLPETLKGKVVVVDFFASWCGPCKASFPALNELHAKYATNDVVIIGVNVDEKRADMDVFLKKHPAQFHVVRDAKQALVAAVAVGTMPTSFVIDSTGKVRFVHSGFRGDETKKQYVKQIEALLAEKSTR